MANEDKGPCMATVLTNLATTTGSYYATVDALTKAFAELTYFCKGELLNSGAFGGLTHLSVFSLQPRRCQEQQLVYVIMAVPIYLNGRSTRTRTTITAGPMETKLEPTIQAQRSQKERMITILKPPNTTSWVEIHGVCNSPEGGGGV
jgi:hypothetical protein